MSAFLKKYQNLIVNYDFINKYPYQTITEIPKIHCIKLYFTVKNYDLKKILTCITALEILNLSKCRILKIKSSIISLKIRKGHPVGCSITLRGTKKRNFLLKLLNEFRLLKYSKVFVPKGYIITSKISNILLLPEFEHNYNIFKNLKDLELVIYTNTKSKDELNYLLHCYNLEKNAIVTQR